MTPVQRFAQVLVTVYLPVGIAGSIPPPVVGSLSDVLGPLEGLLLGLFAVDRPHGAPPLGRGGRARLLQEPPGLLRPRDSGVRRTLRAIGRRGDARRPPAAERAGVRDVARRGRRRLAHLFYLQDARLRAQRGRATLPGVGRRARG